MLWISQSTSLHGPHGLLNAMHDVLTIFMSFALACPRNHWWLTWLHLLRVLPTSMESHRCLYSAFDFFIWHQSNTKQLGNETTLTNLECELACNKHENGKTQTQSNAYESFSEIQEQAAHNHNSSFKIYTHGTRGLKLCNMRGRACQFDIWNPNPQHTHMH